jgi:hypothetical protein
LLILGINLKGSVFFQVNFYGKWLIKGKILQKGAKKFIFMNGKIEFVPKFNSFSK